MMAREFPYLNELCAPIRTKYGFPLVIPSYPSSSYEELRRQHVTAKEKVLPDWPDIATKAEKWLKDNYPSELSVVSKGSGIWAFPSESHQNAMNHGGSLGQDFYYWSSPIGQMENRMHMLCYAYKAVVSKRLADEDAKRKAAAAAAEAERKAVEDAEKRAIAKRKRAVVLAKQAAKEREDAINREVKRRLAQLEFDAEVERRLLALTKPVKSSIAPVVLAPAGGAGISVTQAALPNVVEIGPDPEPVVAFLNLNVVEVANTT